MSNRLNIQGEYPSDWDAIADRVRAETDHRCVRCGHQYKTGQHGKGEWTRCDDKCSHNGPLGILFAEEERVEFMGDLPVQIARKATYGKPVVAQWRILTVHHLDGNKSNCEWWNLLPLCQRCHLTVQARLNPQLPYFLEHSSWFRIYVAGFYAKKYEGVNISRQEALGRIEELLSYERLA